GRDAALIRRHQELERGLVVKDLALEILDAALREIEVRVGVTAEGMPALYPDLQCLGAIRFTFELPRDDEAVRRRDPILFQDPDGVAREVGLLRTLRQRAVEWKVVESERHLQFRVGGCDGA